MNGYNFTDRVRKVLRMAREEAARLNHEYIGTEHLLLGLIREGEGVAAAVLTNLSADPEEITRRVEAIVKKGKAEQRGDIDLPFTSRAKIVLELAMSEAREFDHSYVGSEHLLLGLLREQKGIAAQVLSDAGVLLDVARAETLRLLGRDKVEPLFKFTNATLEILRQTDDDVALDVRHILLLLLGEGTGRVAQVVAELDVDRADLEAVVRSTFDPIDSLASKRRFVASWVMSTAVELAEQESRDMGGLSIEPEHLFLGVLRAEPTWLAILALMGSKPGPKEASRTMGSMLDRVRGAVRRIRGS